MREETRITGTLAVRTLDHLDREPLVARGLPRATLAAKLKIDENKINRLREAQAKAFPNIARLKRTMMSMARNGQWIRTIGGRIYSPNPSEANAYFNTLIQS
jgi:hypothetical protein